MITFPCVRQYNRGWVALTDFQTWILVGGQTTVQGNIHDIPAGQVGSHYYVTEEAAKQALDRYLALNNKLPSQDTVWTNI